MGTPSPMCFLASRKTVPFSPEVTPFAPSGGPTTFVYGNTLDEAWSMMESDEAEIYSHFYFLSGVNYSVMRVIDADNKNALAEAYEYDPYGRHRVIGPGTDSTYFTSDDTFDEMHAGSINNSIRYTGQRFDAESGLMYYKNRYYDPAAGRFIGRDPLGWGAGANRYAYVGGMPTMAVDPVGLWDVRDDPVYGFGPYKPILPPDLPPPGSRFVDEFKPPDLTPDGDELWDRSAPWKLFRLGSCKWKADEAVARRPL